MTTSRTRLFCLVGDPVDHSVSPEIFTRAFEACGVDAAYLAFRVPSRCLGEAVAGIRALGISGFNVTIPHKIAVMRHLDAVEGAAKEIGAVNVVKVEGGRSVGYNTDGEGALRALSGRRLSGRRVAILGYGGAARAVAFSIASSQRPEEIIISGRDPAKAMGLAQRLGALFGVKSTPSSLDGLGKALPDVLINATPLGMAPWVEEMPVDRDVLREGMVVFDLVYNPAETKLLGEAKAKGCIAIGGLEMLVGQAAAAFEIWTGIDPPLGEMRRAAEEALKVRGGSGA
ncbi:MAG: shikimate dehydrogenase [Candidatus Methanosuratincola sp.]|nr:shikimate dehydrogenase [Candidatus Methanosuratincola sp.]